MLLLGIVNTRFQVGFKSFLMTCVRYTVCVVSDDDVLAAVAVTLHLGSEVLPSRFTGNKLRALNTCKFTSVAICSFSIVCVNDR